MYNFGYNENMKAFFMHWTNKMLCVQSASKKSHKQEWISNMFNAIIRWKLEK